MTVKHFVCIAACLLASGVASAQNLTSSANFAGVMVPQHMSLGTGSRTPILYRATVSGLAANTLHRYFNQMGQAADLGGTNPGAGNPLFISPDGTTVTYTTGASLTTAGGYGTFTTNGSGSYTGWFGVVNTGNARFTAGNLVFNTLVLATDAAPSTVLARHAMPSNDIKVLTYATGAGANNGSGFYFGANAVLTPKNFVALYDDANPSNLARPISLAIVESKGAAVASLPTFYTANSLESAAGAFGTIVPNTLPNGIRRIDQLNNAGTLTIKFTDADGAWPSGLNTVNPTAGVTGAAFTSADFASSVTQSDWTQISD